MAVTVFGGSLRIWITVSFSSSFRMQQLPLCSAVEKSRNYTWPFCSFQYNQQYKCLIFFSDLSSFSSFICRKRHPQA